MNFRFFAHATVLDAKRLQSQFEPMPDLHTSNILFDQYLQSLEALHLVAAFENEALVGLIAGGVRVGSPESEISSLYVQPDHRRQGIATQLVKQIIPLLPDHSDIEVKVVTIEALYLFEKLSQSIRRIKINTDELIVDEDRP